MAHHKRRRPKNQRAGCLYCKPYKGNGHTEAERTNGGNLRRLKAAEQQLREERIDERPWRAPRQLSSE